MQRILDFILSFIAILCLLPLFFPIAIVLRFTGEGEIFYKQIRVGKNGKHFDLLKFATMLKDSPSIGAGEITLKNDPRVLPFGKFLRKSKINELPQLWNILVGDLSIIGPRPMVPNTFAKYPVELTARITSVRPGLSGIGSIVFRDEETFLASSDDPRKYYEEVIIPYKADLENWYVQNASINLYVKLILLTILVVLDPKSNFASRWLPGLPIMPMELSAKLTSDKFG